MKKLITNIVLCFLITGSLLAQNIEFKSSNFRDDKDGYKQAVENIDQGDEFLEMGVLALQNMQHPLKSFTNALAYYKKANDFNPDNAALNYKIAKCLLQTNDKLEAKNHLEKSIRLDPEVNPEVYYLLGQVYQLEYKFDEAEKQYKIYQGKLNKRDYEEAKDKLNKRLTECKSAQSLYNDPKRIWIENLDAINTPYPEYCAAISADEYMMIFNSKRPQSTGGKLAEDGKFFADIFVSYQENREWSKPMGIGLPLNSEGQDECLALSPDGQKMYVFKKNGNGDIYKSVLEGDHWSNPEKLPENKVNTESNEVHASFNYNGSLIFFVSDQSFNNVGGMDVFFTGKDYKGEWGKFQTVGRQVINSEYNEASVFMHPDGETMYFSSQGHNSMGGYDIFMTTRIPGGWSKPVNMGYPVNTPFDETHFVMSANGKRGYVTTNREKDSKGDFDIFKVTFLGPIKPMSIDNEDHLLASFAEPIPDATLAGAVNIESKSLTVLKGVVLDDFNSQPVMANIEIVDNEKNEVIGSFISNSKTGKFLVSLPAGKNYGIAVEAEDYLFHSENFNLPRASEYQLVEKEIRLVGACLGCKIILRNIFFDSGKSTLRDESTAELNRLVVLIQKIAKVKPNVKIEISGHTDNVGSESMNQRLSEARAKSVVNYLIQKGIQSRNLVYKGYGESQPIAPNNTSGGRQQNRRTEFKIIEN